GAVQHRAALRRRHHRPTRQSYRDRAGPVGLSLGTRPGQRRLRRFSHVSRVADVVRRLSRVPTTHAPTPIRRILIANRGEIARRIMRTCRDMGISTVAVFSDADRDAPFVREADWGVCLGGAAPSESYLRADAIVAAARRVGSDAIHPGY